MLAQDPIHAHSKYYGDSFGIVTCGSCSILSFLANAPPQPAIDGFMQMPFSSAVSWISDVPITDLLTIGDAETSLLQSLDFLQRAKVVVHSESSSLPDADEDTFLLTLQMSLSCMLRKSHPLEAKSPGSTLQCVIRPEMLWNLIAFLADYLKTSLSSGLQLHSDTCRIPKTPGVLAS